MISENDDEWCWFISITLRFIFESRITKVNIHFWVGY